MTTTTTATATVREIVQAAYDMEQSRVDTALAILGWIEANEGKKLTKRNKPQLVAVAAAAAGEASASVLVSQSYGTCTVAVRRYWATGGNEGWSFWLGEGECPHVSAEQFKYDNSWVFGEYGAIRKRQPARLASLATDAPEQAQEALGAYLAARSVLAAALGEMEDGWKVRKEYLGSREYDGLELPR